MEWDEEARALWMEEVQLHFMANQFVWTDESSKDDCMIYHHDGCSALGQHVKLLRSPSDCVRALARLDLFPFLSPFSLYGLSYCMPKLTSLTSYCALS